MLFLSYRLRTDLKAARRCILLVPAFSTSFTVITDTCPYVMDKADIPEDKWVTKCAALAEEQTSPGTSKQEGIQIEA
jgi:hypothetical protein